MSAKLTIAIDFDNTLTAAPVMWSMFIRLAKVHGHRVCVVTARRETQENVGLIDAFMQQHRCVVPLYFTSLGSKLDAMRERGVNVDIWIDDDPERLVKGH